MTRESPMLIEDREELSFMLPAAAALEYLPLWASLHAVLDTLKFEKDELLRKGAEQLHS